MEEISIERTMITEDYVSFETAKHLNEKGFKGECLGVYFPDGRFDIFDTAFDYNLHNGNLSHAINAPTLQMVMKWLREVHNIHVVPKFDFYARDYTGRIYDDRRESTGEKDDYIAIAGNSTYEQAAEAAIKYCLENLI